MRFTVPINIGIPRRGKQGKSNNISLVASQVLVQADSPIPALCVELRLIAVFFLVHFQPLCKNLQLETLMRARSA